MDDWFLDMTLRRGQVIRRLRFIRPKSLQIEKNFQYHGSGMMIMDIRHRQWEDVAVEVVNFEQDPGITLLAADVIDLDTASDEEIDASRHFS